MNLDTLNTLVNDSGMTKEVLAKKLGISRYSLYNKLIGETEFKVSELTALADALRLTPEEKQSIFLP